MKLILLSGGSGKRLWPLSSDSRSKQFLKVLKTETGEYESMVQRIWRQLGKTGLQANTYITAGTSQLEILQSQLGHHATIILEPEKRDTYPAIALSAAYLNEVVGMDREEAVCVLPVDSFVEDGFFQSIAEMEKLLYQSKADMALIGAVPTFNSAKYGYILSKESEQSRDYRWVNRFVEKPSENDAVDLIRQDALWNCGVFVFRLGYMLDLMERERMPISYQKLFDDYGMLQKISFDYAVLERATRAIVIPYHRDWKDLGTWNTLTEEIEEPILGKGKLSTDCVNTHVVNEINVPVYVLGISNAVVAVGPEGILVTDKERSPRLKEMVQDIDQRPMYEEFHWGWSKVLDYSSEHGKEYCVKRIKMFAGTRNSQSVSQGIREIWTITSGKAVFVFPDQTATIGNGEVMEMAGPMSYIIEAASDLECLQTIIGMDERF